MVAKRRAITVVDQSNGVQFLGDGADFGVEKPELQAAFRFFGEEFRVHPDAGELSYLDFMAQASKIEESEDEEQNKEGLILVMEFLHDQIHPDDWDTFFKLAKRKRQGLEDLMRISNAIVEMLSRFPTGEPADSLPTPSPTVRRSRAGSSSAGTKRQALPAGNSGDVKAAMTLLKGRPDLQHAVVLAQKGRTAR